MRVPSLFLLLLAGGALTLGCGEKKCKSDEDCREGGKKPNQICYEGKCVSLKGEGGGGLPNQRRELDPDVVFKVPVDLKKSPYKGAEHAPVTVVEFSEFECPFCGRAAKTMHELVEAFPKAVRVVFMHNPLSFHKKAQLAAEASQAVFAQKGNEGFWKYHDKLFENRESLDRANLETFAQELGVDMAKFKEALDKGTYTKLVKDQQDFVTKLGAKGAPAFFINGRFVSGAQPLDVFKAKVNEALEAAQKVLAAGKVEPKALYGHLIKDGKTSPVYKN
ncbi:MAG: thioredoxin domain-containing protein [Polyangia bacterium]|nr:thioredoxin domain-containing protein [Polyangia bacterium]